MRIGADLAGRAALFALAYVAGAAAYFFLQNRLAGIPPMWPPAGIVLGTLLLSDRSHWPFWVGLTLPLSVLVHLLFGRSLGLSLSVYTADISAVLLAAFVLERLSEGRFALTGLRSLYLFVGVAGVAAPLVGAFVGAAVAGGWSEIDYLTTVAIWAIGLCVPIILLTPVMLLWRRDWYKLLESSRKAAELALAFILVLAVALGVYTFVGRPVSFLSIVALLWIAARFSPFEASLAYLVHAICVTWLFLSGIDPATPPLLAEVLYFESYLATIAIAVTLSVSLAVKERETSETERARGEARWQALMDYAPLPIAIRDLEGKTLFANQETAKWFPDLDQQSGKDLHEALPAELVEVAQREKQRLIRGGGAATTEHEIALPDGSVRHVRITRFPVRDENGATFATGTITLDITETKKAYEQLNQAQKMEAVGQLTGGVAHDFNNLLAVIIGNLELALESMPREGKPPEQVRAAFNAAERGAALVQRLLAFSRRQALRPEVLDLNRAIRDVEPLLKRTLGEEVEMEFVTGGGLWKTSADPSQVESALINLAINARDAMPGGGRLTVETANVRLDQTYADDQLEDIEPGQYVMIAVSDSGEGMSEAVRARVFEPFFTTKVGGRGSGLGLSMVHGFVKQSGGHVAIYSEVGHGTTIKIYLPRALAPGESSGEPRDGAIDRHIAEGPIRVLVVEDDEDVRRLTVSNLASLGHDVLAAPDGQSAIEIVENAGAIDLLITDVVLSPQMSGPELARTLRGMIPGLSVLFMSGYTANGVVHHGRLDPGVELLEKPFRKGDLVRAVDRALANPEG